MLTALRYGDVHYYYSDPSQKPPHHRFDKGSYVYLFENAAERRVRVEIANNAGTDDQDAFEGCKRALPPVLPSGRDPDIPRPSSCAASLTRAGRPRQGEPALLLQAPLPRLPNRPRGLGPFRVAPPYL